MKKYMMNMGAIYNFQNKKYGFLCDIFSNRNDCWWTDNSVPVIDLTTGKIYSGLGLGRCHMDIGYQTVIHQVRRSIEENSKYAGYTYYVYGKEDADYDLGGEYVKGHKFMDVGSVDFYILKTLYESYLERKEENKKARAKETKKEEESIKKFLKASKDLDAVIAEVKELIK